MWMRKIALCAAAMSLSAAAFAAPPGDASIDELIHTTRMREQTNAMLQNMEKELAESTRMFASMSGVKQDPARNKRMQNMQRQMAQILREEMAWENIQPIYRQIYKESFTQEEIDGMLAFYRSPVGQTMLQKMPQVLERSMQISRERLLPRVAQRMMQLANEKTRDENGKGESRQGKGQVPAAAQQAGSKQEKTSERNE